MNKDNKILLILAIISILMLVFVIVDSKKSEIVDLSDSYTIEELDIDWDANYITYRDGYLYFGSMPDAITGNLKRVKIYTQKDIDELIEEMLETMECD